MSSSRRTLFWVTTTIVVVGAAGIGTALGMTHGNDHRPITSSQALHTSAPKTSSTQQVSGRPSSASTLDQEVSAHPCIRDKKPQTLPIAAGNPYGIDFSGSRLWLYGALESDAGSAVHFVAGESNSTCTVSYAEHHSGRVEVDTPSIGGAIEDYFGDSRDQQIQADLCNAFPQLQDPKYGVSTENSDYPGNACVPQDLEVIVNLNTASTPDNLWIGLRVSPVGQDDKMFEENIGSGGIYQKLPEWQLVIAHVNMPKSAIGPAADFHLLSCVEPSNHLTTCMTSFEYFLNEVIAEDRIPPFSLSGTLAGIKAAFDAP